MDPSQQHQELIEAVKKNLQTLAAVESDSLARKEDLSKEIDFEPVVPHLGAMLDLCRKQKRQGVSALSIRQLSSVQTACESISQHIAAIKSFSLSQDRPLEVRDQIIAEIKNRVSNVIDLFALPLAYTASDAIDHAKQERQMSIALARYEKEADNLRELLDRVKSDSSAALEAIHESAAEAGVASNAHIFGEDANDHRILAKRWMIATIATAAVTLAAACAALYASVSYHPNGMVETFQFVVSKILVLSVLSFSVIWCARNYKSQKHNQTLNKHRSNALTTFRAFVEGSGDPRVKDAILLQAAQAAFSGRHTGFDGPENDAQVISPVVEILGKSLPDPSGVR